MTVVGATWARLGPGFVVIGQARVKCEIRVDEWMESEVEIEDGNFWVYLCLSLCAYFMTAWTLSLIAPYLYGSTDSTLPLPTMNRRRNKFYFSWRNVQKNKKTKKQAKKRGSKNNPYWN